jgi:hypothetical protein
MTEPLNPRLDLVDDPAGTPRTTATLLASLVARVRTLPLLDGAQAVGSMVAGIAAAGRRVATTAEGGRLRAALAANRVGVNGAALWSALGLDATTSALPPRPVHDDLRNDLAVLLASDLVDELERLDETLVAQGIGAVDDPAEVDFLDFVVGLWFLAGEVVDVIEGITSAAGEPVAEAAPPPDEGSLLR